jgi:hypothetical protein
MRNEGIVLRLKAAGFFDANKKKKTLANNSKV